MDWFSIVGYEETENYLRQTKLYAEPQHLVFDDHSRFFPQKIVDEPFFDNSPLQKIYRVMDLDKYFQNANFVSEAPLLISPSFSKLAYLNPLTELWSGFNEAGSLNRKVTIIGFSLPEHDEYLRQPIYKLIRNFQHYDIGEEFIFKKTNLKLVDYRPDEASQATYKRNYRFVEWDRVDCYFGGFNHEANSLIFEVE